MMQGSLNRAEWFEAHEMSGQVLFLISIPPEVIRK